MLFISAPIGKKREIRFEGSSILQNVCDFSFLARVNIVDFRSKAKVKS